LQTKLLLLSRIRNLFIYQNINLVVLEAYIFSSHLKHKIAALPKIFHNTAQPKFWKNCFVSGVLIFRHPLWCHLVHWSQPTWKKGFFLYYNSCFDFVLVQVKCFGFLCLKAYFC